MSGCVLMLPARPRNPSAKSFRGKERRDYMTRLTVAAAAFAAGMMTFAVHAEERMADNPKTMAERATTKPDTAKLSASSRPDLVSNARWEMTGTTRTADSYRFSFM